MRGAHIVRIEVDNFKSYKGKHTIGPFSNLSCVIGPNGAGKSNITDAVGFTFGVSAASMRITAHKDLIHNGCAATSVTVVLSVDGAENTITRTVKSNDAIAIKLNDRVVPEKDLEAFLSRCNISVSMKNFLVFQHEVEAIAQKRSKELTDMMEVVSGSCEFRERYAAARKAVDEANRKTMTISTEKRETNAEVNKFRLQKKEADRFTVLSDRMARERMELALMQLFHIEVELTAKKEAFTAAKREVATLEGKSTAEGEAVKESKKTFADLHRQHLLALKAARDKGNDVREKRALLERLRVNVNHLEIRKLKESTDLTKTTAAGQSRTAEMTRLEGEIKAQESELRKFEEACGAQDTADGKISFSGSNLTEYKRLRKEADCDTVTMRQELETSRRSRDAQRDVVRRTTVTHEDMAARVKEVDETAGRATERAQQLEARLKEVAEEHAAAKVQADSLLVGMQHLQQGRAQRQEELSRVQSQLDQLRFTKDDNRHQRAFTEALTAMQSATRGIRGRLVDLCSIPNAKYTVAVTVALGKNLEAVVVDTQAGAMECVRYLRDNRVGVMDFIPIDAAKGKGVDDRHRSFGGTCRPVMDVIKCDAALEPALRYALGQTLVCDTIEEARRIAYHAPDGQRYKVVTVDGSVLLKNGAVSGGLQTVKERAKKWDERTYDALKATRQKLQTELFDSPEAAETKVVSDAKGAQGAVDAAIRAKQRTEEELAAVKDKLKALALEKKKLLEGIAKGKTETERTEHGLAASEKEMAGLQAKVKAIEAKVFAEFQTKVGIKDLSDWEDRENHKSSHRAEKRHQFMVLLARLRNQLEAESKRIGMRNAGDLEGALGKTDDELKRAVREAKAQEGVIAASERANDTATKELQRIKKQLDEMEAEIRALTKKGAEENDTIARAKKTLSSASIGCEKLRVERKNVFMRCTLDDVTIPTVKGEDARKRVGATTAPPRKKRVGGAEGDEDSAVIAEDSHDGLQTSEPFAVDDTGAATKGTLAIEFKDLSERLRKTATNAKKFQEMRKELEDSIAEAERDMDRLAPNLKASGKYVTSEKKLDDLANTLEDVKDATRRALVEFNKVKEQRASRFIQSFEVINENVGRVYKDLTEGTRAAGVHGTAYLTLDDVEEPYNAGTKYHATPPMKRFMGIEALSGGERTMAALALLFAIHSVRPAPFVILDEVDAALDTTNVVRLAQYLRAHCGVCQFIVVSLKEELYHRGDSLIGVYKDKDADSSAVLTLDLSAYAE